MTRTHQRLLLSIGSLSLGLAGLLAYLSGYSPHRDGTFDFYPGIAYLGFSLVATAGLSKLKGPLLPQVVAWLLNAANVTAIVISTFMVFLLLPANQRTPICWFEVVSSNGLLFYAAFACWRIAHREVTTALMNTIKAQPAASPYVSPEAVEPSGEP